MLSSRSPMAIPWPAVLAARAALPIHVQAEFVELTPPDRWPGPALATVRVARSFRGDAPQGTMLAIALGTLRRGQDDPLLGDFHYEWEGLRGARFIELFLGTDRRLPSNSYSQVISSLSETPQMEEGAPSEDTSHEKGRLRFGSKRSSWASGFALAFVTAAVGVTGGWKGLLLAVGGLGFVGLQFYRHAAKTSRNAEARGMILWVTVGFVSMPFVVALPWLLLYSCVGTGLTGVGR